jgi:hypothetical protein
MATAILIDKASRSDEEGRWPAPGSSYTHRKEYTQWVGEAKKPETRQRRVEKTIEMLRRGTKHP